jgi:hypothetical protein
MPIKEYKGFRTYQRLNAVVNAVAAAHAIPRGNAIQLIVSMHREGFLYHHTHKQVWVLEDELHGPSRGCPGCLGDGVDCGLGDGCCTKKEG